MIRAEESRNLNLRSGQGQSWGLILSQSRDWAGVCVRAGNERGLNQESVQGRGSDLNLGLRMDGAVT